MRRHIVCLHIHAFFAGLACAMPDPSFGSHALPPLRSNRFFSDQVMGGVSTGEVRVVRGACDAKPSVHRDGEHGKSLRIHSGVG